MSRWNDMICVGQLGVGVHLFPAGCLEGETSLKSVTTLTRRNGLVSEDVKAIAGIQDELYIACESSLCRWNWKNHETHVVAIITDNLADSPLKGAKSILGMMSSQDEALIVFCSPSGYASKNIQAHKLDRDGNFAGKIADNLLSKKPLSGYIDFLTTDSHCFIVACRRCRPQEKEFAHLEYGYDILATFDCGNKSVLTPAEAKLSKPVLPEYSVPDYDIANYGNGTIAIVGYGLNWKIQYFTRDANDSTCAWAPTEVKPTVITQEKPATEKNAESESRPSLTEAAANGKINIIKDLLSQGEDINIQDDNGWTPLIHAISSNKTDCAILLVENGADVNLCTKAGCAPISFAADKGYVEIVKRLIKSGADVRTSSNTGLTPLYSAAYNGHLDVATLLIEKGADVNAHRSNENRWTPIFAAATQGHIEIVKLLLDKGVDVDQREKLGRTVLMETAFHPHPDVLELLIERGADINAQASCGCPTLIHAIMSGNAENLRVLAKHGVDIHSAMPSQYGRTPLMHAAWESTPEVVQCLLDLGAKVDAKTDDGKTALFFASSHGKVDNIRVLLNAGADVTIIESRHGQTAIDRAGTAEAKAILMEALGKKLRKNHKTP